MGDGDTHKDGRIGRGRQPRKARKCYTEHKRDGQFNFNAKVLGQFRIPSELRRPFP
jgi:hypothetical protein